MLPIQQNIVSRPFQSDEDFWRVRNLLVETYPITPTGFNWEIRRWDGWRYHRENPYWNPEWQRSIHLWETQDGVLVGAVHTERLGEAFMQLHPDFRYIEEDMLLWSEANLSAPAEGGRYHLDIFAFDYDAPRHRLLTRRGYERTSSTGVTRRLRFGGNPFPDPELAQGYDLRTIHAHVDGDDKLVADLLNAAFGRSLHTAREFRTFATLSPSFQHDLHLVAQAPDGSFASLAGVTYDKANRRGIFEPVCTHPAHRRKGLARALIYEGFRRLKTLGATDAYVDTGDAVPANLLYDAVGFTEAYTGHIWRKWL